MDARPSLWTVLIVALAAPLCTEAHAEGVTAYFESAGTSQKARSHAGLSLTGDRVQMRADLAVRGAWSHSPPHALYRRSSGSTEVVPNMRSAFTIAKNLDIETRVNFAEWNAGADRTVDTRVRYRKSLGWFFDELDGSLWRLPGGLTRQALRLGFGHVLGNGVTTTAPLAITGAASFEATRGDNRKVGVETRVAGLLSPLLTTDHAVSLKVEKTVGARQESASTLAYDQSWTPNPLTEIGFSLMLKRETYSPANDFAPAITFTWRGQF
jgi:hypothetical protein